ncbi:MAG: pyridoxamine 5'-phosphate oxidase family protein [Gammaproteobacteria bacterium]|nr:pyridoxamine 5'-phosphate oxidase family protein [Gammaproteobacteria bacterium]
MIEKILQSWPVGVLSTFGTDGIDSVPIVFVFAEGALYSPVDAKPKSGRKLARIENLERDPRYTLLLQHYDEDWTQLWWLRIRGRGAPMERGNEAGDVIDALRAKYPQYRTGSLLDSNAPLLRLDIETRRVWAYQGKDWLASRFD